MTTHLDYRKHSPPILGDDHLVREALKFVPQRGVLQLHRGPPGLEPGVGGGARLQAVEEVVRHAGLTRHPAATVLCCSDNGLLSLGLTALTALLWSVCTAIPRAQLRTCRLGPRNNSGHKEKLRRLVSVRPRAGRARIRGRGGPRSGGGWRSRFRPAQPGFRSASVTTALHSTDSLQTALRSATPLLTSRLSALSAPSTLAAILLC